MIGVREDELLEDELLEDEWLEDELLGDELLENELLGWVAAECATLPANTWVCTLAAMSAGAGADAAAAACPPYGAYTDADPGAPEPALRDESEAEDALS
jgi:hypothetical protein